MKLLGSNVLLKRRPPENSLYKETFLILPDVVKFDSFECEVIDVGPGEIMKNGAREPMEIEVGQIVVVPQGTENHCQLEDDTFIIDVCAVEARVVSR